MLLLATRLAAIYQPDSRYQEGVIETGIAPPYNFSRIRIESAIKMYGFQLWRTKRPVVAATEGVSSSVEGGRSRLAGNRGR